MMGWYAEDYAEFVKECTDTVKQIEYINADTRERPPKGAKDWSKVLLALAKQQVDIANFMAMQAGVDDY